MSELELKPGDIFFTDSDKTGPKIVKFLMASPTLWHWLIGKIGGLFNKEFESKMISPVRMYHAGIILSQEQIIEQEWKVEHNTTQRILGKKHVIWRFKHLSEEQKLSIKQQAEARLGTTYDLWLILGKTLTWLTGIQWFVRHVESKDKDICITFVAYIFYKAIGYRWGRPTWHEITTDIMDDWNASQPEDWELISKKL